MLRDTFTAITHEPEAAIVHYQAGEAASGDIPSTVVQLLSRANEYLERDRAAAKQYLDRAAKLLETLQPSDGRRHGEAPTRLVRGGLAPWQINRLKAYVDAHLSSAISLDDMAQICRLSTSHFARAFKTSFGVPPHSYVVHQRIAMARQMMLATGEPLSQIAFACGFADQSHFSRLFRRLEGISPNAWRRTHAIAERAAPAHVGATLSRMH